MQVALEGVAERLAREHDDRIEAAWITARLLAYPPEKSSRFTKLDKLLINSDRAKPQRPVKQDWRTQSAMLENW